MIPRVTPNSGAPVEWGIKGHVLEWDYPMNGIFNGFIVSTDPPVAANPTGSWPLGSDVRVSVRDLGWTLVGPARESRRSKMVSTRRGS